MAEREDRDKFGRTQSLRQSSRPSADPNGDGLSAEIPETVAFAGSTGELSGGGAGSGLVGVGQRLADFILIERLGAGGMGVVYKARQISLNRIVALKLIRVGEELDTEQVERFRAEAEAAGRLDHRGIVPVYEIGREAELDYYAMGYVAGESLASRLQRGPLEPREAAALVRQVAEALAFAHARGIIHRDVKPGNILLDSDNLPRLADFGLARRLDVPDQLTRTGQVLGTPSYMAPEQARGERGQVGPRSDVYSLGAVLYATLTGRPPFVGANVPATLRLVHETEPVSPRRWNPAIDRDLETICLKCLEKAPAARYATAQDLADDLERYLAGRPIASRPLSPLQRLMRWSGRHPAIAGLAATILCLLVVGFAAGVLAYREVVQQRDAARKSAAEARLAVVETIDAWKHAVFEVQGHLEDVGGTEHVQETLLLDALPRLRNVLRQIESLPEGHRALLQTCLEMGRVRSKLGETAEALRACEQARSIGRQLVAKHPEEPGYQLDYLLATQRTADFLAAAGMTDAALERYREVQDGLARLPQTSTTVLLQRFGVAYNLAIFFRSCQRDAEALARFEECLVLIDRLAESEQPVGELERAAAHSGMAAMLLKHERFAEAENHAALSLAIATAQFETRRRSVAVRQQLASSLDTIAGIQIATGAHHLALQTLEQGEWLLRNLLHEAPGNPEYRRRCSAMLTSRAHACQGLGDTAGAEAAFAEAWRIIGHLQGTYPDNQEFRFDCVATCQQMAMFELSRYDAHAARCLLEEGRSLIGTLPDTPYRATMIQLYSQLNDTIQGVERCLAEPEAFRQETDTQVLSTVLVHLAAGADPRHLVQLSDHLLRQPWPHDVLRYNVACAHALAAERSSDDGLRRELQQRAVASLRELAAGEFFEHPSHAGLLETDRTWDELRERPDFPRRPQPTD